MPREFNKHVCNYEKFQIYRSKSVIISLNPYLSKRFHTIIIRNRVVYCFSFCIFAAVWLTYVPNHKKWKNEYLIINKK